MSFAHLHVHSHYSLLTGLGKPGAYAKKAAEAGMPAVALTDFGNMHGAVELYDGCKSEEINPIIGYDAHLAPRSRIDKEPIDAQTTQIVLLAKNNEGYRNLLRMASEANLTGFFYRSRIDWDLLTKHSEGIIALSGGIQGEIPQSILKGDPLEKTKKIVEKYKALFGKDFYFQIQRHPNTRSQFKEVETILVQLSKEMDVPLVATNDVHYPTLEENQAQDIMLCIRENAQRNDPSRAKMLGDNFSLRSPEEMRELFEDLPEACDNTVKIAEQCEVKLTFGEYLLPPFPVPEEETVESYLQKKCEEGLKIRYGFDPKTLDNSPPDKHLPQNPDGHKGEMEGVLKTEYTPEQKKVISERLYYELGIINQMGFPAYFLIVWDFVKWSKDNEIAVGPGRGSAAGSLVSYCLTITNIDPIRYDLLFERFLNPERVSMPDIDIDFADDKRDAVLQYVRQKYGDDRVAQICTFGTMAARAAIKDVGRVMGLGFADMNGFVKLIPEKPGISLDEAVETAPDFKKAIEESEKFKEIFDLAKTLEGSVRHVSVHACAAVISPDTITNHTAIQRAPKDENTIITQYSAKPTDKLGLLKMDFLGLKNLTILTRALEIIEQRHKVKIDLDHIPLDDEKSYKILSAGQTTGVFQLESAGMRRYLKELKPNNLEDIIAMVSLYRPGPMEWIPDYIQGKHGKKKVKYIHESLEPLLNTTFGIAIYQEQILQIAQVFAGFTLGQADLLRRAIGKKIPEELAAQREKFIEGATVKGYSEKLAIEIFDKVIEPFAGYGFNKSHAAGYAMIAYQTAYLKANYPTEFMTALLSSDKENTDRVIIDIEECREMKIEVLPPNVNESFSDFTAVEDGRIRFGLTAIKGVGESVVQSIIEARGDESFTSLADFAIRCPSKILNKKSLESLAKSGALAGLAEPTEVIEHCKIISDFSKENQDTELDESQDSLFGDDSFGGTHELTLPETEPVSEYQLLSWERETLGLFVSGHPLQNAKKLFHEKGTLIANIARKKNKKAKVGGLLMGKIKKIMTKTKKQMAILQIEDPTGKLEAVIFPNSYEELADKLIEREDIVYWLKGKVDYRNGMYQIIVDEIKLQELSEIEKMIEGSKEDREVVEERTPEKSEEKKLECQCPGDEKHPWKIEVKKGTTKTDLQNLHQILTSHPGKCAVEIHAFGQVFYLEIGVDGSEELKKKIERFV